MQADDVVEVSFNFYVAVEGNYIFIQHGFGKDYQPQLTLQNEAKEFVQLPIRGQELTLTFQPHERICTGWHDLATSQSFACPAQTATIAKFTQCRPCQQKTGFNPAFYYATEVSAQQEARNRQPHFLYLAHFAPGVLKAGISWQGRGLRRLLEQGARSALVIKTYPSANVARTYEAKAVALPGVAETLRASVKYGLLNKKYDHDAARQELLAAREQLVSQAGIEAEPNDVEHFDATYLPDTLLATDVVHIKDDSYISGQLIGMVGSALIAEQNNQQYMLPLSDLAGSPVTLSSTLRANPLIVQQTSLF